MNNILIHVSILLVFFILPGRIAETEEAVLISDVLVDGVNCRGAHVSTRPHNRKVSYHTPSKTWYVFYGTGHWTEKLGEEGARNELIAWRSSKDGKTFSSFAPAIIGNGHSSSTDVLLVGDRIYIANTRWGFWRQRAGIPWEKDGKAYYHRGSSDSTMFYVPYEVFTYDIIDGNLVKGITVEALPGDHHVMHAGPHYGSITRDSDGRFWVAARALADKSGLSTWVARTSSSDNVIDWEPYHTLFKSSGPGSHAPQIIALDNGLVACVLFAKYELMTMVFLFNPISNEWGNPHIIGKGYQSKRASAVFDPGSRRLHVVYTDSQGDARHRSLTAPYNMGNWFPSLDEDGTLVATNAGSNTGDDDLSLSVNTSKNPAPLALVHRADDLHLHLKYYDGDQWSPKDVKVGLDDSEWICDEASAVADFSHGFGFLYASVPRDPEVRKKNDNIVQLRFCLIKNPEILF
ncbi:MAG: hypothetical protein HOC71_18350 [Candidatus Latescibacteria bacterium]|jgi:hypothetical protein|nr:hypothetical protein [Candidatus Latescibacterota bacterium]